MTHRLGKIYLICAALVMCGCYSTSKYKAGNLPQHLAASPSVSANKIDLSALAGSVQASDRLVPGDSLIVSIASGLEGEKTPEWNLRIGDGGRLNVPLVGPVPIAGLRLTDAERTITSEAIRRGVYVTPNVTLKIEKRSSNQVTVLGAVKKPRTYELPMGSSDLMTALSMAEGFSEEADTVVQVRHPPGTGARLAAIAQTRPVSYPGQPLPPAIPDEFEMDLTRLDEIPAENRQLVDGSVVMVRKKPARFVNVMGLVRKPDSIQIPEDRELRLLDAISMAGGRTESLADKVTIIREMKDGSQAVIRASIRDAKKGGAPNMLLKSNDLVSVDETPTTYVVGTLKTFFRFGFSSAVPGI